MSIQPGQRTRVRADGEGQNGERQDGGRRAWDGDPPLVAAARQRLLEATARCIARDGLAATSVAAIAAEAGVSRQTVYRYFASRNELAAGAILRAADGVRAKIDERIRGLADPADMIVEALVVGLLELRTDPVLRGLSASSGLDGFVATRITEARGIAWAREAYARAIEAAGWSEADAATAIEFVLRIFLSLITSPSPARGPEELRAFLYRHLVPGLGLAAVEST